MYKFNLLNKINQEKLRNQKVNHIVNMIFYSTASISVVLILIMIVKSLIVGNSLQDYQEKLDDIVKKTDKLRGNKGYMGTDVVSRIYNYQDKRVAWTEIFSSLQNNIDSLSALEELSFNGAQIECKVLVKVDGAENNKASIMKIMTGYQLRLAQDSVFIGYLRGKSDKGIIVAEQPNLNQQESNVWYYRLRFDLKDVVKPAAAAAGDDNSKRRF